jgi:integrase
MVSVKIKHVEIDRKGGKEYVYFRNRRGSGKRYKLPPLGTPEFFEAYSIAAEKDAIEVGTSGRSGNNTTMSWLVQQYYLSADFKRLDESTKKVRRGRLERFCQSHGERRFKQLEPKHLYTIRDMGSDTPAQTNNTLKDLRQVYKFAVRMGHVKTNPAREVEYLGSMNPDGFHAWTLEEVSRYEAFHPVGSKARLVLALLLYTGQRRSDIVRLGRQHEKDGCLIFRQHKGRNSKPKDMEIPIISELRRVIDLSPTGDLTYLVTEFGRPFTANGFGNWFKKRCSEAGLPHCSAHGVRKVAGYRMAELGCSTHEIAAILGHTTLKEVERYTRKAKQKHLAASATERIENALSRKNTGCVPKTGESQ